MLHQSLRRFRKELYGPSFQIRRNWTLNDLWRENGRYATDVYAEGDVSWLTVRQVRAHGIIFVGPAGSRFSTRDAVLSPDVVVRNVKDAKDLETQIGRGRIGLRRAFGNAVRDYAWTRATYLHGSEVETVTHGDIRGKKLFGQPPRAPLAYPEVDVEFVSDGPVDEKLVSMLDYAVHGYDTVLYVGAGDGRTLTQFARKDPRRFRLTHWILIDPIVREEGWPGNVTASRSRIDAPRDLARFQRSGATLLLWDVRSDRGTQADQEWEETCRREDDLGESVAMANSSWLDSALLKRRIPFSNVLRCTISVLCFQPGAPADMYELRSFLALSGHEWLGQPANVSLPTEPLRRRVQRYHGRDRGRSLRTRLIQTLHIEQCDGLQSELTPRADLFYLTNRRNAPESVFRVVAQSEISTLWIGARLLSYDDYTVDGAEAMLRCSTNSHMVVDGLGFLLLLMLWGEVARTLSFDPGWAGQYAVIFRRRRVPPIPDVWLCRFIGLRANSSLLRIQEPCAHETPDLIKCMGIDLSGHLYVSLVTGRYVADLRTWFQMILTWSILGAEEKKDAIARARGEVIEWKDQMESKPWHLREDLIAALRAYRLLAPKRLHPYIDDAVGHLRVFPDPGERTQEG
uniref:Core protein VP4 n=1 Tax=Okhotskiy virus TaxID=1471048 RepID=A0A859D190_9REOV|nr:VP3 [Okhotskiy virus]